MDSRDERDAESMNAFVKTNTSKVIFGLGQFPDTARQTAAA